VKNTFHSLEERFFFLKKAFLFLNCVLGHYNSEPSRVMFRYKLRSSIQWCAPIFRSSNYYSKYFFLQIRQSAEECNSSKIPPFLVLLATSLLLKMMLDCLECVHQFKESILRCFSRERHRKRSHFDGILFSPFQKRMDGDSFYWIINGSERFLYRQRTAS
jgi:hypothetical protein